jgi:hypothetical protein
MRKTLSTLALCVLCTGCGKEMGRVPFASAGTGSNTVTLKAGEVSFWTDIDIEYDGTTVLTYDVTLSQSGTNVATVSCDPLGQLPVKSSWVETDFNNHHSRRGNGKMTCNATLATGGPTLVTATLSFASKPSKVTLKKADLALRQ